MIIFLYGQDSFRSRLKLKEFKDKFIREVDPDGSGLITIDGETANLAQISDAANSSSLFCRKRMIVVENILKNKSKVVQDEIADFLKKQKKEQDNILIFWDEHSGEKLGKNRLFNFLRKAEENKFVQSYEPLSNPALATWVKTEVVNRGGKIAPQAVTELCSISGNDLWFLNNEINKLVAYRFSAEISVEDIRDMVRGKLDENIFALTDAIGAKNKALTMELIYR
jgi:DNA polymerase III delta subunit